MSSGNEVVGNIFSYFLEIGVDLEIGINKFLYK